MALKAGQLPASGVEPGDRVMIIQTASPGASLGTPTTGGSPGTAVFGLAPLTASSCPRPVCSMSPFRRPMRHRARRCWCQWTYPPPWLRRCLPRRPPIRSAWCSSHRRRPQRPHCRLRLLKGGTRDDAHVRWSAPCGRTIGRCWWLSTIRAAATWPRGSSCPHATAGRRGMPPSAAPAGSSPSAPICSSSRVGSTCWWRAGVRMRSVGTIDGCVVSPVWVPHRRGAPWNVLGGPWAGFPRHRPGDRPWSEHAGCSSSVPTVMRRLLVHCAGHGLAYLAGWSRCLGGAGHRGAMGGLFSDGRDRALFTGLPGGRGEIPQDPESAAAAGERGWWGRFGPAVRPPPLSTSRLADHLADDHWRADPSTAPVDQPKISPTRSRRNPGSTRPVVGLRAELGFALPFLRNGKAGSTRATAVPSFGPSSEAWISRSSISTTLAGSIRERVAEDLATPQAIGLVAEDRREFARQADLCTSRRSDVRNEW